jgi:DNA polymerase
MAKESSAEPFLPHHRTLQTLREAAAGCQGCDLYQHATQTVFGAGEVPSEIMLVGEQPGNEEDLRGEPFVGPAGRFLDRALAAAGIDRARCYVTNAVKHFKWVPRGKRRLHAKPTAREVWACHAWLRAELDLVRPRIVVCLGATASHALLGSHFRVSKQRGELLYHTGLAELVMATVHPSSILRAHDAEKRARELARFVADLQRVAPHLERAGQNATSPR